MGRFDRSALRQAQGERDAFDSLEKAQWRKFKDAVEFIDPRRGEALLEADGFHTRRIY